MKKDIVHPNIQKTELHIRETVLVDGKTEEIEKVISFPNAEVNDGTKSANKSDFKE